MRRHRQAGCLRLNIAARRGRGPEVTRRSNAIRNRESRRGRVMTSVRFGCGVMLMTMIAAPSPLGAASPPAAGGCTDCAVRFHAEVTPTAGRIVASGAGGVVLDKRMDSKGLAITISAAGDTLRIVAASNGVVTLTRRDQVVTVRPESTTADYQSQVRELIAGSAAVEGLDRMVLAVRNARRPQAASVMATFALLRSLQGDQTGNTLLAQSTTRDRYGIVRIGQTRAGSTVNDCWDEYERTLSRNSDRYSRCLRDYWWAQPVQYACGLEFAMVAELALFSLISCSGGFPI